SAPTLSPMLTVVPAGIASTAAVFASSTVPSAIFNVLKLPEKATVDPEAVALALFDMVIAVPDVIDAIVVLAGMLRPVTSMPTTRLAVDCRFVRVLAAVVVFPVCVGPTKDSATPDAVAVALFEIVIVPAA